MSPLRAAAPWLAGAALHLAHGCGASAPSYTLQQVMLQIEHVDKGLVLALETADAGAARGRAEELVRWWQDRAFAEHLGSPRFLGDRGSFDARRSEFASMLAELTDLLRAGDLPAARAAHERLRAACDSCHAEFRPELLVPRR